MSSRSSALAASFAAVAACLLLSGCFSSETPKFPLASAAAPFGDGGRYQGYERTDGDNFKKDEIITVKRRTDGGYDFVNQKGEVQPISFHRVAGENFVGQASPETGKTRYAYVIFRVAGNEAFVYLPDCEKQDKAQMEKLGVVFVGRYECAIDRVADPAAFFASLTLGEPTSKLVRE
jgi:hypothetical protein